MGMVGHSIVFHEYAEINYVLKKLPNCVPVSFARWNTSNPPKPNLVELRPYLRLSRPSKLPSILSPARTKGDEIPRNAVNLSNTNHMELIVPFKLDHDHHTQMPVMLVFILVKVVVAVDLILFQLSEGGIEQYWLLVDPKYAWLL